MTKLKTNVCDCFLIFLINCKACVTVCPHPFVPSFHTLLNILFLLSSIISYSFPICFLSATPVHTVTTVTFNNFDRLKIRLLVVVHLDFLRCLVEFSFDIIVLFGTLPLLLVVIISIVVSNALLMLLTLLLMLSYLSLLIPPLSVPLLFHCY